mgnify:CR=1 FL=1
MTAETLQRNLSDRNWRLDNLYTIQDKDGRTIPFKMNAAQRRLLDGLHPLSCILKARQLGFSTFIAIFTLDALLFNAGKSAGMVDRTLEDAKAKLQKMKFAYENMPKPLRDVIKPGETWTTQKLTWDNGSSAVADVSLRGGTYQFLHVSEYGKIAFKDPARAEEIATGAFNTVSPGNHIFVESTHEGGKGGRFYELCKTSMEAQGQELTNMDFKFVFEPWFADPAYSINPDGVHIPPALLGYFDELELKTGVVLTPGQRAWYAKKKAQLGHAMLQEFPSTPEEAFEVIVEGAIYGTEISEQRAKGWITNFELDATLPVFTFWDIGFSDTTAIWAVQLVGREIHLVDHYENNGEPCAHYARVIQRWIDSNGYHIQGNFLPHDAGNTEKGSGKSYEAQLIEAGIRNTHIVPRTPDRWIGINHLRGLFNRVWIRRDPCQRGVECLEAYRTNYNERLGKFADEPLHDWASNSADALRTFSEAHMRGMLKDNSPVGKESRRGASRVPRAVTGVGNTKKRRRVGVIR